MASARNGFWHVSLETASGKSAVTNDLSFEQVDVQIVRPWKGGRSFTVAGVIVRSPETVTTIRIVKTRKPLQDFVEAHEQRMAAQGIADFATKRRYLPFNGGEDQTHELLFAGEDCAKDTMLETISQTGAPVTKMLSILFMDLSGWSKLTAAQIATYLEKALPALAEKIGAFNSIHLSTWGDAVVATFASAAEAAECALDVRDFFRRASVLAGVPNGLVPRIALHVGETIIAHNPLLKRTDIFGSAVHLAARLEPVTPLGEVYCTSEFASALGGVAGMGPAAHLVGNVQLPKDFGMVNVFAVTGPNELPPRPAAISKPEPVRPTPLGDARIRLTGWLNALPAARSGQTQEYADVATEAGVSAEQVRELLPAVVRSSTDGWTVGHEGETIIILVCKEPEPAPARGFAGFVT